jgi:hypothetical protein
MVALVGLDAASARKNFGYALGHWVGSMVRIEEAGCLEDRTGRDGLARIAAFLARHASARRLLAIDAPLGWPAALSAGLARHRAGEAFAFDKQRMFRRETERRLREGGRYAPLEVGADRIARAAHEALAVLAALRAASGMDLPLVWDAAFERGGVIEVYPAATLKAHRLPSRQYKVSVPAREAIAARLQATMPQLHEYVGSKADVFDACICLLAAADFLGGACVAPPREVRDVVEREGWIWVREHGADDAPATSPVKRSSRSTRPA